METYTPSRISAIHLEIQGSKPTLCTAIVNTFLVEVSPQPRIGRYLSPIKYTNLGGELAEMMNLGILDHAIFANGFGLRIGLNRYAESLKKVMSLHPVFFLYKKAFSKIGVDTSVYNEQETKKLLVEMAQNANRNFGINQDRAESWMNVCMRSGQSLGTAFLQDTLDANTIIQQMERSRVEIMESRPPEIATLFDF